MRLFARHKRGGGIERGAVYHQAGARGGASAGRRGDGGARQRRLSTGREQTRRPSGRKPKVAERSREGRIHPAERPPDGGDAEKGAAKGTRKVLEGGLGTTEKPARACFAVRAGRRRGGARSIGENPEAVMRSGSVRRRRGARFREVRNDAAAGECATRRLSAQVGVSRCSSPSLPPLGPAPAHPVLAVPFRVQRRPTFKRRGGARFRTTLRWQQSSGKRGAPRPGSRAQPGRSKASRLPRRVHVQVAIGGQAARTLVPAAYSARRRRGERDRDPRTAPADRRRCHPRAVLCCTRSNAEVRACVSTGEMLCSQIEGGGTSMPG